MIWIRKTKNSSKNFQTLKRKKRSARSRRHRKKEDAEKEDAEKDKNPKVEAGPKEGPG